MLDDGEDEFGFSFDAGNAFLSDQHGIMTIIVIIPESIFEAFGLTTQLYLWNDNGTIRNIIQADYEFNHYNPESNHPILSVACYPDFSCRTLSSGDVKCLNESQIRRQNLWGGWRIAGWSKLGSRILRNAYSRDLRPVPMHCPLGIAFYVTTPGWMKLSKTQRRLSRP